MDTLYYFFMWLDSLIKHHRVNNLSPIPDPHCSLWTHTSHVYALLHSMDLPSCEPSCTILTFNSFQNIWIPSRSASHELLLCLPTPRLFSLWGISLTCLDFRMCVSMLVCLKETLIAIFFFLLTVPYVLDWFQAPAAFTILSVLSEKHSVLSTGLFSFWL